MLYIEPDPILHIILKHHWYDLIKTGKKRVEYREVKPYWTKRLFNKPYRYVLFRRGYAKNAESILFEIDGPIEVTNEPNDLNLSYVYRINFKPYTKINE